MRATAVADYKALKTYPARPEVNLDGPVPQFRVAIDIGGTFTDLLGLDEETGALQSVKLPSTPRSPATGVLAAFQRFAHPRPAIRVRVIVHATTLAANALLGQTGLRLPKAALVTTRGFRDVLEIGRQRRPELYNLFFRRPPPLIPRRHRYEVTERLGPDGHVWQALHRGSIHRLATQLRAAGIQTVAVCLLHSYANPVHEETVGRELRRLCPGVQVTLSHQVAREYREYERTSTTVVHAVLRPLLARYVRAVRRRLRQQGLDAPLYLMQSSGGIADHTAAETLPGSLVESGPAAGVVGAAYFGRLLGQLNILSFDMGGTTAKAGIIHQGHPEIVTEYEVGGRIHAGRVVKGSGYPIRFCFLDLAECSAGGGTIAYVDQGALRVGPLSAGAEPGPACYGKGGTAPTVTDAQLVLGRLPRTHLLGGALPTRYDLAENAIQQQIAAPLGLDVTEAAAGIIQVINATMTKILRMVSVERGYDPRDFGLLAFGGAGPMHACSLAEELNVRHIVVPPEPGLFSAYGLLVADFTHTFVRAVLAPVDGLEYKQLRAHVEELEREALQTLHREGFTGKQVTLQLAADLRYVGQSHEITVTLPQLSPARWRKEIARRFHRRHRETYGFAVPEPVELVNLRLTAIGHMKKPRPRVHRSAGAKQPLPFSTRRVFVEDVEGFAVCRVYQREHLPLHAQFRGPTIIEQFDATTVVPPSWQVSVDGTGALLVER